MIIPTSASVGASHGRRRAGRDVKREFATCKVETRSKERAKAQRSPSPRSGCHSSAIIHFDKTRPDAALDLSACRARGTRETAIRSDVAGFRLSFFPILPPEATRNDSIFGRGRITVDASCRAGPNRFPLFGKAGRGSTDSKTIIAFTSAQAVAACLITRGPVLRGTGQRTKKPRSGNLGSFR